MAETCRGSEGAGLLNFTEAPLRMGSPTGPGPGLLKPGGGPSQKAARKLSQENWVHLQSGATKCKASGSLVPSLGLNFLYGK